MIQRLQLENYRAFENLDIDLKKINLFFGPNNSGKSSILSVFNLLAQTMETGDLNNPLLLNGKYEEFGTYKDLVFQNKGSNDIVIKLELSTNGSFEFKYSYRPQRREIILSNVIIRDSNNNLIFKSNYSAPLEKSIVEYLYKSLNKGEKTKISNSIRLIHFIPYGFRFIDGFEDEKGENLDILSLRLVSYLKKLEFIGPFRDSPKRTYLFSGENPKSIGRNGEKAIDIIASDYMRRGKKQKGVVENISKWLKVCEIADNINIKLLTDRHFEIRVKNIKSKEI